jgi:hypothetical protein
MSLPSPKEIAAGAPLEDVYLYVERGGETRAIGHEMRTTLPEVVKHHDPSGDTLRVVRAEPGQMSTREIDLDHAASESETGTETPAPTHERAGQAAGTGTALLQTQTERILDENERLRTRLAQIRSQYESRIDALEERYQERIGALREALEEARDEADRAKDDMGAWERIAVQAGPKVPQLLGAITKKLSAPPARQARGRQRHLQGHTATPESDQGGAAETGDSDEGGGSGGTEVLAEQSGDDEQGPPEQGGPDQGATPPQEIDEKEEVLRMEIVQSALKVINGPVSTHQFEQGLREAVKKGAIDEDAIPHSIERVVWFVDFVNENLSDYIGVLQSVGPQEAADMLAAAADAEVSDEGRRMIAALLEHAET